MRFRQTYRVVLSGRFAIQRMPFAVAGSRWARHPRLPRVVSPARRPATEFVARPPPAPYLAAPATFRYRKGDRVQTPRGASVLHGYASGALIQYEIEGDSAGRFMATERDVRRM